MTRVRSDEGLDEFEEAPPTQPHEAGFDRDAVHTHIKMLHDLAAASGVDGVLVLACYGENPDTGRKTSSRVEQFAIGDVTSMVDAIMALEHEPHLNVYAPWAVLRPDLARGKRGELNDIVCTLAFVADMDADTGKAGELPFLAPYVVESSPGNFQPVYPLARALPPGDAAPIAKALQRATGTDHGTGDVAHVWRVPGTLNWPNKRKLEDGRPREPQPVRVASGWTGELIEPEKLWEAVAPHAKPHGNGHDHNNSADWQLLFSTLTESLKKLIASPPMPGEDRSAVAASVIFSLIGRGWSDNAIAVVIRAHPQGIGARHAEGKALEADIARLRGKPNYVDWLNRRHAVVLMGGEVVVVLERGGEPTFMSPASFHLWHAHRKVDIGMKRVPISRAWIAHPRRRQYSQVVFDPQDTNPKHYNLWRGFAVLPDSSKSCAKFLAHVRDNICGGDEERFKWVMGFLAHMVQKPQEKPGVSLVLRGPEGIGKGFFANVIGRLCPQHYVVVSQSSQLTGRFNAHFQRALLIFVDEGFWAGDKPGEGALKHLVTDRELLIEGKHKDAFMVRNLSRLIIASNEKWVVPAGIQARRWCVLDVADTRANDRAYFSAIDEELQNGGLAALMHYLMNFDLASVDVYTAPKTAALLEQKEESFPPHVQWWAETLKRGTLRYENTEPPPAFDFNKQDRIAETEGWPASICKDRMWESYRLWMREHNVRSRVATTNALHRWFNEAKLLPGAIESKPRGAKRQLILPALTECRTAFDTYVGQSQAWEDCDYAPAA
jgi:hypothetical protein